MKLKIIAGLALSVALLDSTAGPGTNDPVFQGRRLSAWLNDLHNHGLQWRVVHPEVRKRSEEAAAAFRKMGPNVISALMDVMRGPATNTAPEVDSTSPRMQAAEAIALFGAEARGTIPELIGLMKRELDEGWAEAIALSGIGLDALIPVSQALTNSDQRLHQGAAEALSGLCSKYNGERVLTNAVPALTTALLKQKRRGDSPHHRANHGGCPRSRGHAGASPKPF